MALSERDIEDFIQALQQSADLRERVRAVLLADDFMALPALVGRLAEETADLTNQVKGLLWQMNQQIEAMRHWSGETANIKGQMYEWDFQRKLSARIGPRFASRR